MITIFKENPYEILQQIIEEGLNVFVKKYEEGYHPMYRIKVGHCSGTGENLRELLIKAYEGNIHRRNCNNCSHIVQILEKGNIHFSCGLANDDFILNRRSRLKGCLKWEALGYTINK